MKSRHLIKIGASTILSLILFTCLASARPNFVFIFADDLGWGDLGCYGHSRLKTPYLDKMAAEGLLVTNFYVANPVCSPSRTAVMTGQYPARHRIHRHLAGSHTRNAALKMADYLDPDVTILTKLMKNHGYKTGHFGKWHLGSTEDAPPFDEYGIDVHYTSNSRFDKLNVPQHQSTEKMVDEAIAFIKANKEQSFYINLWTLVPHTTLVTTDEQMAPYERWGPHGGAKERGFSTPAQIYYGAVTDLDYHIGRLIRTIDDLGLSEETIIVFSSDNGPEDISGIRAGHSAIGTAGPFRGRKRSLYEGGVRVPFIVQWKGHTPAGRVDDRSIVSAVDLLPTFCSQAGIELPDGYISDGQDMSQVFLGESVQRKQPLYWDWTGIQAGHTSNKSPSLAMRSGRWKFLMNPDGSRKELYDFDADPQSMELDNVADRYPDQVRRFSEMLSEFKASIPQGVRQGGNGTNDYPMPVNKESHMEWWRDARFGMFIHWGLYSVQGGEWKGTDYGKEQGGASAEWLMNSAQIPKEEYRNTLAPKFNPINFDAEKWVSTAKDAGMKYMVITSKHHDGFCLFETEATDYNIMEATPFKRDIIKELSEECARQGIKFGVYYSQFKDWYHRSRGRDNPGTLSTEEYLDLVEKNLDELLSNYGEMAVLWFDTGGNDLIEANAQGTRVRELQPDAVICSRLYNRRVPAEDRKYADFESLPDRMLPKERMLNDAETCMTMRHNWGYDRTDDAWKSPKDIIEFLALCGARGVNLLLNVGPTPEGTLLPEEIERLEEVGEWMKVNGESIYGTKFSPVDFDFWWGAMTRKDKTIYLHVLEWKPERIEFNGIIGKPSRAYFLADPERKALPVTYEPKGHVTEIKVPATAPDSRNTVIALEYNDPVVTDPDATGKYHWYTNRRTRHTDIQPNGNAGRKELPGAVTGDK